MVNEGLRKLLIRVLEGRVMALTAGRWCWLSRAIECGLWNAVATSLREEKKVCDIEEDDAGRCRFCSVDYLVLFCFLVVFIRNYGNEISCACLVTFVTLNLKSFCVCVCIGLKLVSSCILDRHSFTKLCSQLPNCPKGLFFSFFCLSIYMSPSLSLSPPSALSPLSSLLSLMALEVDPRSLVCRTTGLQVIVMCILEIKFWSSTKPVSDLIHGTVSTHLLRDA